MWYSMIAILTVFVSLRLYIKINKFHTRVDIRFWHSLWDHYRSNRFQLDLLERRYYSLTIVIGYQFYSVKTIYIIIEFSVIILLIVVSRDYIIGIWSLRVWTITCYVTLHVAVYNRGGQHVDCKRFQSRPY